jgi:hypothetical protein
VTTLFEDARLDGVLLLGPVVGAGTQLDLDLRRHVTGGVGREDGGLVQEQALAVGHVGIRQRYERGPRYDDVTITVLD